MLILLAIVLGLWFGIAKWCKKRQASDEFTKGNVKPLYEGKGEKPRYNDSLPQTHNQAGKGEPCTAIFFFLGGYIFHLFLRSF